MSRDNFNNKAYDILSALKKCHKSKNTRCIVNHLDDESIDVICEALHNFIWNPKVNLSQQNYNKITKHLTTHKNDWTKITNEHLPVSKRRIALKRQYGTGIFSLILSTIIPLITSLLVKK